MRRILFTVVASAAVMIALPAMALAHGDHHHKGRHHTRVHHLTFKAHRNDSSGSSGSPAGPTSGPAGTVTSFANDVLMITLADGSTITGQVTSDTRIRCATPAAQNGDDDGDDNASATEQGDRVARTADHGGDNGDSADTGQSCTITPGEAVGKAELTVNGNGAFWNEVELVTSTAGSTTTGS